LELRVLLFQFVVDGLDERAGLPMLLIVVFPFLCMLNLDVHGEPLGHNLNIMP